ncbi:MAG: hypothetical protein AAFX08_05445 [Pseudomonadota bacterium]
MLLEHLDLSELPSEENAAFLWFESNLRAAMVRMRDDDRDRNVDRDGEYDGDYEPEREFAVSIIAFLDRFKIDHQLFDPTEETGAEFYNAFRYFDDQIKRLRVVAALGGRLGSIEQVPPIGLVYTIDEKEEISGLLSKIRKIVVRSVKEEGLRERILKKLRELQAEIDRFGGMLFETTEAINASAANLEPTAKLLERIKSIFWSARPERRQIEKPEEQKRLPKPDGSNRASGIADDIPF